MHKKSPIFSSLKTPFFVSLTAISALLIAQPLYASTVKMTAVATLCVTTKTKAMHANTQARFEKATAPYAKDPKAANAIQVYRESLTLAWEAMEQPYCGQGSPGAASASRSYTKTVDRAHAAFLANIKSGKSPQPLALQEPTTTTQQTQAADTNPPSKTSTEAPATTPSVKPVTKIAVSPSEKIITGPKQGTRSASVKQLQKKLYTHYRMPNTPTDYFGTITRDLVIKFQLEKKIISSRNEAGAGLVGPKTLAAINKI